MELREAINKFREYWPNTNDVIWGEAFETICAKAVEGTPSASQNSNSLQCVVCGSHKVNVLHDCKDCGASIDVSNWRD